ncbi:MAG: HAD family phosphatase [Chlorobi bacterium]|nr:HAD family phosphatase [Chlorobiota bacterium]
MKFVPATIKNIIFDLGRVILNLDLDASVNKFRKLGLKNDIINEKLSFSDKVFYEFQTGAVSSDEFRARLRKLLNNKVATDSQIDDAWMAMIADIPFSRIKVIQELRKQFKVYLFSNTNEIHVKKLHDEFRAGHKMDFYSVFDKIYYSHEIHDAKPAVSSYLKVIADSGVTPGETLFVDDLMENIEGAEKAGLKGFWLPPGMDITEVFADYNNEVV